MTMYMYTRSLSSCHERLPLLNPWTPNTNRHLDTAINNFLNRAINNQYIFKYSYRPRIERIDIFHSYNLVMSVSTSIPPSESIILQKNKSIFKLWLLFEKKLPVWPCIRSRINALNGCKQGTLVYSSNPILPQFPIRPSTKSPNMVTSFHMLG